MKVPGFAMSLWERGTRWAEFLAGILYHYWLLLIGGFLILGSAILKWVQFPFTHNLTGLRFSFLHDPGITPHLTIFSAVIPGLAVLAVALLLFKKLPSLLCLAAAILITLWALAPVQVAFRQPSVLRRLTSELEVAPLLNAFSKDYLLQNYGSPELVPKRLTLYTAWGRLSAATSFMRFGWYCFGLGAVLIGCYGLGRLPGRRLSMGLTILCLPVGALLIVALPALLGQHYYSAGTLAAAQGHNQEAIDDFHKAMRWDAWHSHDIDLYATIGHLQKQAGIGFNAPERHISRAVDLRAGNEYEAAIFEFSKAEDATSALAETARREIAITRMSLGLALYRAGGIGSAVTNWELALAEDPSFIYVMPYLTRGYYDLGRYQAGIEVAQQLAKLIKDHNYALANVYSMAADCYAKLGNSMEARRFYQRSLQADPILNYWALTGLAGE